MVVEITVILKDPERIVKQKFLCYQRITLSEDDPYINDCIKEAKQNFNGEPEDVILNFKWIL